jgi:hypothetical protein
MKNYEITFKKGLLIDKNTGKRLNLKPFETYFIQSDDDNFLLEDYTQTNHKPRTSAEKLKDLEERYKGYVLKKILPKETLLCFRIGLSKRLQDDVVSEYLFEAKLEEDLFIKQKKGKETWSLCNCICSSNNLLEGELGFPYQKVQAKSLSELFANVVATYFSMKRSTTANAFKEFYLFPINEKPSLKWIKESKKGNLDHLRKIEILKAKAIQIKAMQNGIL